jgi:hypothetical protein
MKVGYFKQLRFRVAIKHTFSRMASGAFDYMEEKKSQKFAAACRSNFAGSVKQVLTTVALGEN